MIRNAKTFFKIVNLVVVIIFLPGYTQAQDGDLDKSIINESDQPTLLIFSGSDWCLPCIRFHREVVINSEFVNFSKENLNVQIADFPQHKKLTKKEVEKNEVLAEKYNPQGYFPHVLLLNAKGQVLTQITTNKVSAEDVIEQISLSIPSKKLKEFSKSLILMGSSFQISIVAEEGKGEKYLEECVLEIKNIESWLSSWKENSITSQLNSEAWQSSVQVPIEYYALVERCLGISTLTQGAFDITFSGLGELYSFDKTERILPAKKQVDLELEHVGYEKVSLLRNNEIGFTSQGVKIGFGAIGKGYAADKVKKLMQGYGVEGGIINASGDLITWGRRANGNEWKIGIPDPQASDEIILWLPFKEKAIATSGDYEKYFTANGHRYSHIVNPKTGLPVVGSASVSVISDSAELSDALATAVSVLGLDVGMNLINQLDGIECVFIDNNRKLHFSSGLQTYAY